MRHGRAVHRKNRHALSDALFRRPDDPAFGQKENDRMPELQGAVSDGIDLGGYEEVFVDLLNDGLCI